MTAFRRFGGKSSFVPACVLVIATGLGAVMGVALAMGCRLPGSRRRRRGRRGIG